MRSAPTPAACHQCANPELNGMHDRGCPQAVLARGKKPAYTLEVLKRVLLETIALTNAMVRAKDQVPGYREAVDALPNRDLLRGLPMEIRSFLERELDAIEDSMAGKPIAGCPGHPRYVFQCGDCDVSECTECGDVVEQADVTAIKTKAHVCMYCRMSGRYWIDGKMRHLSPASSGLTP